MPGDPEVIRTLRAWKELLRARDARQMRYMARHWLGVERALRDEFELLAREVDDLRYEGQRVSAEMLFRLERYQVLLQQTRVQVDEYADWADEQITERQRDMAGLGLNHAAQTLELVGVDANAFTKLPVAAVENIFGLASDGTPLRALLDEAYPDAAEGITNALLRSVAMGRNPRETAREMADGLTGGLNRMMLIARDQQNRVYRYTAQQQYLASGVVYQHRRIATHDDRVCAACLMAEGETLRPQEPVYDHPQGRCSSVPDVDGLPPVRYELGRDWLLQQPEATQRAILGPGRFQAWQEGRFDLDQLVTRQQNPTWGRSLQVTPLYRLN